MLLALTVPSTRLVFVTSLPIDEWILRYYFSLLPLPPPSSSTLRTDDDVDNDNAKEEYYKKRVHFFSVGDPSLDRSLTQKILDHPRLLSRLMKDDYDHDTKGDNQNNNNDHDIVVGDKKYRILQQHQRELMLFRSTYQEEMLAKLLLDEYK